MTSIIRYLASVTLLAAFAIPVNAQAPTDRTAFVSLYRELVETNTTYSAGAWD